MSKINRVRIVNLNYNGNTVRVDDETFDFGGKSTLISLKNGGGKTVLVQMISSLFMNKSFRDTEDRPFKSYFTTPNPTFIMTEWILDNGYDKFIAGMMVRKYQGNEENADELEMINFTGSYETACGYDIDNIPVVEDNGDRKIIKGFVSCRNEFDKLKKDRDSDFNYYDMSSQYQRRQYFAKLKEYQISNKEWESIIKKVNIKESGLSDLFTNAKDERGLIENWFLEAIKDKLNNESNRIKEFQSLIYRFIGQYRDNQSHIKRKEIIQKYFADSEIIGGCIDEYMDAVEKEEYTQSEISGVIKSLENGIKALGEKMAENEEQFDAVNTDILKLIYEKISDRIYKITDERNDREKDRADVEAYISGYTKEIDDTRRERCSYKCAKIYNELEEFEAEKTECQEKINVLMQKKDDSREEAERLGKVLYAYYSRKSVENENRINEKSIEISKNELLKEQSNDKALELEKKEIDLQERIGRTGQKIVGYSDSEDRFNRRYGEKIQRNILGKYDDGMLAVKEKEYEDNCQRISGNITRFAQYAEKLNADIKKLEIEMTSVISDISKCKNDRNEAIKKLNKLEEEKTQRFNIMKYAGVPDEDIDNKVLIIQKIEGIIKTLDIDRNEYQTSLKSMQDEYEKLRQGRVLELPENIAAFFEDENIEYFYGMEWIKNNGRSVSENRKLIEKNPFIPYSVIIDRLSADKLMKSEKEIFTGLPIPVIVRDEIENVCADKTGNITTIGSLHFMVMFNHHLLDEQELAHMLLGIKKNIEKTEQNITQKNCELDKYRNFKRDIESQEYSAKIYDETVKKCEKYEKLESELQEKAAKIRHDTEQCKVKKDRTDDDIIKAKLELEKAQSMYEDFKELEDKYADYEKNLREKMSLETESAAIRKDRESLRKDIETIIDRISRFKEEKRVLSEHGSMLFEKVQIYINYKYDYTDENEDKSNNDIVMLESRYNALTNEISSTLSELQKELQKHIKRCEAKQSDLKRENKYEFDENDYSGLIWTEDIEEEYNKKIKILERKKNAVTEQGSKLNIEIGTLNNSLKNEMDKLKNETGYDVPAERKQIVHENFDEIISTKKYEAEKIQSRLNSDKKRYELYENIKSHSLDEYAQYDITRDARPDDIENMSEKELNTYCTGLKREWKKNDSYREKCMIKVADLIRDTASVEEYKDEFFRKGFDNLLSQTDNAYSLKKQHDIIIGSYRGILEKLEVDLANIDKERKNVEEVFLEYNRDVNEDLGKIDKNSTIKVRGRELKMLKIKVPDWETGKERYKVKLHDYIDIVVRYGIDAIENNRNVEDVIGKLVTTKKMYDEIVGIENIGIRMYKIEEEREVPISWADVSANSGGEGFLSAFVILVCLLSYMRRDDADIFSRGEEGKVLIMDNPFAQTNAAHLLKPLMEMAERTNTQLICLSGLGGDSIYNRFDNIYVLKLINSSIRKNMRYLNAEHTKGEDIKKLTSSEFKMEQMELFDII